MSKTAVGCQAVRRLLLAAKLALPTIKQGSVHIPSARAYCFVFAIVAALTFAFIPIVDNSLGFDMPRARCCSCQLARNGTCQNCSCAKSEKGCTDCLLSRDGLCSNSFGCGPVEAKAVKLTCPFDGCVAGKNGKPLERRPQDISRLRSHLSSHLREGFSPSHQWLLDHDSQLCPGCSLAVVSLSSRCSECRARVSDAQFKMAAPRAHNLPKVEQNHVVQLSLGATADVLNKGVPARARVSESKRPAAAEVFVVEKIIDKRRVKSKVEYLVVWKGYTSEHNSWEPISSFKGRVRAIDDFERTHLLIVSRRGMMFAVVVILVVTDLVQSMIIA